MSKKILWITGKLVKFVIVGFLEFFFFISVVLYVDVWH